MAPQKTQTGRRPATQSLRVDPRELKQKIQAGDDAYHLLQNPHVEGARKRLRANIVRKWEQSSVDDFDGQKLLKMQLKAFDELFRFFEETVNEGRLAAKRLEDLSNE